MNVPLRMGFLLWDGRLGGAERHTVELCRILRTEMDVEVGVVFIGNADRTGEALDALEVPWLELGLARGSHVLRNPAALVRAVSTMAPDALVAGYGGYLALALRLGGYRGTLVSVEHGGILQIYGWSGLRQLKEMASRASGERLLDGTVCVSNFVLAEVDRRYHARCVRVIYNGVDTSQYSPTTMPPAGVVFGHAGRLIEQKGLINLVRAFDKELADAGCKLLIAGDGPARERAEEIVREHGVEDAVEFRGVVADMASFWRECSLVVHPTTPPWHESFCLAVVEAMACGLPAIVSDAGALPEIIAPGVTGTVVPADDMAALREAMLLYAKRPDVREDQGRAARERAVEKFDIRRAAREYVEYLEELRRRA